MPISYKHKIHTTLGTPTDLSGDVVSATDSAGVPAKDYTVKGRTIVWNQLLDKSKYSATITRNGVTFTNNGDGTITVNGTGGLNDVYYNLVPPAAKSGHKYMLYGCPTGGSSNTYDIVNTIYKSGRYSGSFSDIGNGAISRALEEGETFTSNIFIAEGYTANNLVFKPQLFDLTQMFGAGNEPATVAEFRAMFPDDYYPYNAGELKSIMPTSVEASTVNLLNLVGRKEISSDTVGRRTPTDAYPEIDTHVYYRGVSPNGYLSSSTVTEATVLSSSVIAKTGTGAASHAYGVGIPLTVVPSTTYYIKCTTSGAVGVGYANSNKIITSYNWTPSNNQFTTPGDCRYALIVFRPNAIDTLATFENICVSTVQTNEYQPYNKYRANIPSSKYFPDGMRSAGSAYDEINFLSQKAIKRIGAMDLGTLNWTYNGAGDNRYFETSGISDIKKVSTTSEMPGLLNVIYTAFAQTNWYLNKPCMFKIAGNTPNFCISDPNYTDAAAFKAAMSGVMLYYELATPVETTITPPLQALPTYKGFTSFSAPNSLTQNGPLSVAYYAEGGANPEKGWLTSYKRKLYMGRTIEWNQLLGRTNRARVTNNGVTAELQDDGSYVVNGTATDTVLLQLETSTFSTVTGHKYFVTGCPKNGSTKTFRMFDGWSGQYIDFGDGVIFVASVGKVTLNFIAVTSGYTCTNLIFKPQLFDLTQMFGAGNEPATPEEFWSYFDHKLYLYNAGETQPLFKISRKSQWGSATAASLYVGEDIIIPQIVRN